MMKTLIIFLFVLCVLPVSGKDLVGQFVKAARSPMSTFLADKMCRFDHILGGKCLTDAELREQYKKPSRGKTRKATSSKPTAIKTSQSQAVVTRPKVAGTKATVASQAPLVSEDLSKKSICSQLAPVFNTNEFTKLLDSSCREFNSDQNFVSNPVPARESCACVEAKVNADKVLTDALSKSDSRHMKRSAMEFYKSEILDRMINRDYMKIKSSLMKIRNKLTNPICQKFLEKPIASCISEKRFFGENFKTTQVNNLKKQEYVDELLSGLEDSQSIGNDHFQFDLHSALKNEEEAISKLLPNSAQSGSGAILSGIADLYNRHCSGSYERLNSTDCRQIIYVQMSRSLDENQPLLYLLTNGALPISKTRHLYHNFFSELNPEDSVLTGYKLNPRYSSMSDERLNEEILDSVINTNDFCTEVAYSFDTDRLCEMANNPKEWVKDRTMMKYLNEINNDLKSQISLEKFGSRDLVDKLAKFDMFGLGDKANALSGETYFLGLEKLTCDKFYQVAGKSDTQYEEPSSGDDSFWQSYANRNGIQHEIAIADAQIRGGRSAIKPESVDVSPNSGSLKTDVASSVAKTSTHLNPESNQSAQTVAANISTSNVQPLSPSINTPTRSIASESRIMTSVPSDDINPSLLGNTQTSADLQGPAITRQQTEQLDQLRRQVADLRASAKAENEKSGEMSNGSNLFSDSSLPVVAQENSTSVIAPVNASGVKTAEIQDFTQTQSNNQVVTPQQSSMSSGTLNNLPAELNLKLVRLSSAEAINEIVKMSNEDLLKSDGTRIQTSEGLFFIEIEKNPEGKVVYDAKGRPKFKLVSKVAPKELAKKESKGEVTRAPASTPAPETDSTRRGGLLDLFKKKSGKVKVRNGEFPEY